MHWFQNKENKHPDDKQVTLPEQTKDSSVKLERDACMKHLGQALSSNERGVVLKLYIENFKQLKPIIGL